MLPRFKYLKAQSSKEAIDLLADHGEDARVMAGGTDLFISMKDGLATPRYIIDIKAIEGLQGIRRDDEGGLSIGSCVTVSELLESEAMPKGMEAIKEAASVLATQQVRNRATVGGNICNASPACDLGPPLLVLGARVRTVSRDGGRTIPLTDFFTCPKETCLAQVELAREIVLPENGYAASGFLKRTRVKGHDLATVNAAAAVDRRGTLRLALGAVAPRPILVDGLEGLELEDKDRILKTVLGAISPIDDIRGSAAYRRHIAGLLVERLIAMLKGRMKGA